MGQPGYEFAGIFTVTDRARIAERLRCIAEDIERGRESDLDWKVSAVELDGLEATW